MTTNTMLPGIVRGFLRGRSGCSQWLATALLLLLTGPAAFAQLSGTYTINSGQPTGGTNFASFTAAVTALNQGGISAAVTFNVSGGPYTEQVSLAAVTGASATNRVVFNGNGRTIQFGSTTSTQRAVVTLNGADYITLDSLRIDATNAGSPGTYGWGLQLTNQADHNMVRGCTVLSSESSTSSFFAGIVVSGSATSATTGGNAANDLLLEGNTVSGGYYGITLMGTSSSTRATGNVVRNNTVRDFYYYGVYAAYQSGAQYQHNDINRLTRTTVSVFYGLYVYYNLGSEVTGNRIHDPFTAASGSTSTMYGIYNYYSDGTAAAPMLLANNLVYNINSGGTTYGIYNYYCDYTDFYHNTVLLDGSAAGTAVRAYSQYVATYATLRNNIFAVTKPASTAAYAIYAYYSSTTTPALAANNNNLYVEPAANAFVGYYGTSTTATTGGAATLAAWQAVNGGAFGQNSLAANPYFVSPAAGNLRPTAAALDGAGTAATLSRVPLDITGATRTSPPDMGAYEFSPAANDVALRRLASPTSPLTAGVHPVSVSIRNNGGVTLNSMRLTYTLNGGTAVSQAFSGLNVASGDTALLSFTSQPTFVSGVNTLRVVASLPNGGPDANAANDTLQASLYTSLAGTYTINNGQPTGGTNFASFTAAVTALNQGGISAAVTFNVSGGPYTEQISLAAVTGASATNRVVFNGNGRTIQFGSTTSTQRAVVTLNGADYITLDSLRIDATNAGSPGTYGWGLQLTNQADHNMVRGCTVLSSESSTSSFFAGIVVSGSATSATTGGNAANDLLLEGNTVSGGYYGITLMGAGSAALSTGNVVRNNTIRNFYYYGLYSYYQHAAQYQGNDVNRLTRTGAGTCYGMYLAYNDGMSAVGNRIHDPYAASTSTAAFYAMYVYYSDGTAAAPILVANNAVYNIDGGGVNYGIYSYYSNYVDYYHNTVSLDGTSTGTTLRAYYQYTGTGNTLHNNIFSVTRPAGTSAYAIYIYHTSAAIPVLVSNNNDLFVGPAANAFIGYYGTSSTATSGGAATLAAWQAVNGGTFDQNSVSLDPQFRSISDPRPTSVNLNGTGTPVTLGRVPVDAAGVTRNNPPDIPAFEFTPTANDVVLVSIDSPATPATPGINPVVVTIRNGGTAVLTSATLSYRLNAGTPVTQPFTGLSIAAGATQQLTFTQGTAAPSGTNTLTVTANLPNGQPDGDPTNNALTISFNQPTPDNDEPCTALVLSATPVTGSNTGSSTSVQSGITLPACAGGAQPQDVWFSFTATSSATMLTLTGNAAGAVRVFSSASCSAGPFTQVFCQGSSANNTAFSAPLTVPGLTVGTTYYVAVSGFGSASTTGTFTIAATAVLATRASAGSALSVYPNPSATGQLSLRLATGTAGTGTVELRNALGQVVKQQPLAGAGEQQVATTGLAAGLYTLRVQAGSEVFTRKVVLQ